MTEPANKVIDKMERGERPSRQELIEAGYCLECEGFGSIWVASDLPGEDDEVEIMCKKCGGTGEAAHQQ